jgi:hypothetical protein
MSATSIPKKKKASKNKELVEEFIENVGINSSELIEDPKIEASIEQKIDVSIEQKIDVSIEPKVEPLAKETITEITEIIEKKVELPIITSNLIVLSKTVASLTLIEIISEDVKNKAMVLNKDYVDTINILIKKKPALFSDIEQSIYEIMKDGKVDSNDVPHLIKIIQKLYESVFSIKLKLSNEKLTAICSEVIKNIFKIMIKERKIKVELDKQEEYLEQFNKLIESCSSLLSFQKVLKSRGCFSALFK